MASSIEECPDEKLTTVAKKTAPQYLRQRLSRVFAAGQPGQVQSPSQRHTLFTKRGSSHQPGLYLFPHTYLHS